MKLTDRDGMRWVEIRPDGYEFEHTCGDKFDDNWLFIAVQVKDGDLERRFRAACMLVVEMGEFALWLELLADEPYGRSQDHAIAFIEPHLDFAGRPRADRFVEVIVRFEYLQDPRTSNSVEVRLIMDRADLASAASDLKREILPFPERRGISAP